MKKMLLVANVAKEHVLKFHVPSMKAFSEKGWIVDVACSGKETIPFCHEQYDLPYERAQINFKLIKGIRELQSIIDNGNYDLVYCHTTIGGVAGRLAARKARKKGTKVVYLSHGYYFYKGGPVFYWPTFYLAEKLLSFFTDAIITINQEDFHIAKKHFSRCKAFLINGIGYNPEKLCSSDQAKERQRIRNELSIPGEATILIYLAELHANKNQGLLLNVLARLLSENENVYLVLAGMDHADGRYQRMAEDLGIENRVRFLGWRDDIGSLLASADICTASSIREGFGLNLVESMACGVPVVATRNRGHDTIIQDGVNGFLVDRNDTNSFINAVKTLIHDDGVRRRIVEEGLESSKQYSSETVVKSIQSILDSTVSVI